uniref:PNPLA domain-containing protein n=1 Tax=Crocodylus porosus TaxID=8502 RepID=A0A7M4E552_CROPO
MLTHKPCSLFFKGCGFLIVYELGVVKALKELAPEILRSATKICGSSSGSIVASLVTLESMAECNPFCTPTFDIRSVLLGPISPNIDVLRNIEKLLYKTLPENAHQLASGRLHIILTRVSDRQNVVVSDFRSKEELVQVRAAVSICELLPNTNITMIIVSALGLDNDICPKDKPGNFFSFYSFQQQFQIQLENIHRVFHCFFPPGHLVSSHQESMQPQAYLLLCGYNKHCLQG